MSKGISQDQFHYLELMNTSNSSKISQGRNLKQIDTNDPDLFLSEYHRDELRFLAHVTELDDLYICVPSPPFQACGDEMRILSDIISQNSEKIESNEEKKLKSYGFPSESMEILKKCRSRVGKMNGRKIHGSGYESNPPSPLSTNHIIELAARNFINLNSSTKNKLSAISHPYVTTLLDLSTKDAEDIKLVQDVLICAEKVHDQKYDCASKLLEKCNETSLSKKTAIQRLMYCFTEGLREKIERETGRSSTKLVEKWWMDAITSSSTTAALHERLPLTQVSMFAGVQSMIDHVSAYSKVHIIDLQIRCGVHHTVLMQALATRSECHVEHLKITAVTTNSKVMIKESGIRLKNLADSLNINFSFDLIFLEDIKDLQQNLFELNSEEGVVINASYALEGMIAKPGRLEALMRVVKNINPLAMIITEAEANANSPTFVNRFVEALFFYGAYFDCMDECLKNDVTNRTIAESKIFSPAIRNVVAAEGEERKLRIVGIDIWRKFFARFGMVEIELSKLALCHANLVRKSFDCHDSCAISLNGNCLIVDWKGTPVYSLSAWKFQGL